MAAAKKTDEAGQVPASEVPDAIKQWGEQMGFDPMEKLLPELERWLVDIPTFGRALKHPLCFDVPYFEAMAGYTNKRYLQMKEIVEELAEEGKWYTYVFMHERPYRLETFTDIAHELSDEEYWEIAGGVWTDTENLWQNYSEWHDVLDSDRAGREMMMDEDERVALAALPDEFTIYRGFKHPLEHGQVCGLSWTLDRERAVWFASRWLDDLVDEPAVATARVKKSDVIAHFLGRGEQEIVVLPEHLIDLVVEGA